MSVVKQATYDIQPVIGCANAENIIDMIVREFKEEGLDISKMVGIGTDGASVITGRKAGIVVKLREHYPSLIGVHCAALATSQAAKSVTEMDDYFRTVTSIFKYFAN